jgi:hypothetical protein
MAVDVIIDPSSGQIYWNDAAGSGTQTIAISGNATNAINIVGYSNFFSPGGGGLGTQILATFNDSATSTFVPGTNSYDLGSSSLRWNFYGTGGNFTGVISTSSSTASTSTTTGALVVSGGAGIAKTSYFGESVVIQGSTASTTPTTGALVVTGGVGISGKLMVGTKALTTVSANLIAGFASSVDTGTASIRIQNTSPAFSSLASLIFAGDSSIASIAFYNSDSGSFTSTLRISNPTGPIDLSSGSGKTISLQAHGPAGGLGVGIDSSSTIIQQTTVSTSSTTGALVVSGGAGIAKTSYFGESVVIQGTTASGATTTGALVVTGGVGIGGSLNVFGTIDVANNIEVLSQKEVRFFNSANTFYTGLRAGSSSANVTFTLPIADGTANQVLYTNGSAGLAWTTVASVSAITTLNGLTAATQTFATGTSGTDFNISSATSTHTFNIPYAGAASTGLITTQTQTIAGAKTFSGNTAITSSTASTNPINGALVVTGGVGISGRLNVGRAITSTASGILAGFGGTVSGVASVFIQNTSSAFMSSAALALANDVDTAYISLYNSNSDVSSQELSINNGAGPIKLTSGSGQTISFLPGGSAGLKVSSTGTSVERSTASTSASSGALTVLGGAGIAKTSYFGQDVFIQGATSSTSTTTGALTVAGGLGVVGDVYIASATNSRLNIMGSSGDEGGEIFLNKAVTNTTLKTGVSIDINQNRLRFFETGGSNRGAYIDLTACSTSVGTNLLVGSGASGLTSLNGLTSSTQTFATGTSGTDFNISSGTSTHTFNIPYAGAASTGLITTQTQTIAGAKTFSSQTVISDTTASTSAATGALRVAGGLGVSGSIRADFNSDTFASFGSSFLGGSQLLLRNRHPSSLAQAYLEIQSNASSYGQFGIGSTGTDLFGGLTPGGSAYLYGSTNVSLVASQQILLGIESSGLTIMQVIGTGVSIRSTTASTSTTTGALRVIGGVGIGGSIWSGQHIVTDTTTSTTTSTGAMLVFGGLGVSGQINAASLQTSGNAVISGNLTFNGVGVFGNATTDTINSLARYISDILPSADNSYDLGNNSLGWRNFRVSGVGTVATLQVTSITSGLWAGSAVTLLYGGTNNNISGVGHSYRVAIYDAAGTAITNISSAGTANSVLFQSSQSASPIWAGQSQLVVGGASTAANIQGGALGNIHYQTGANTTGFVTNAAGSGASILSQTGNAAPVFLGQSQLAVGSASIATSSVSSATTTDTTSTLYLLGSRSSTGFAGTAIYVDTNISILGSQVTAGVWAGTAISAVNGGTGQVSYTIGDILYASSTTALAKLAAGTAGSVLKSNGAGTAPSWQADATGSGGAGTVAAPSASNLIAYYPGTGASVASTPFVSIESTNSAVEISSQNSKSALILNAANGSVVNLAEFKGPFGDVFWSFGTTGQELKGTNGQLKLNSASYISLVSPATVRFYNPAETFYTAITGSTTVSANVTYTLPPTAPATGTSVLQSSTGGTLSWVAMSSGGGSGTVTSGTAGSVAFYTGSGTTVGGAPGFTYTTAGTASTVNIFGGGTAGTYLFTVQAYSATSVRVGIGTNLPQYELEINGEISATNKSFVINHPTKPGKKLRYGSLEGPENGVYVRGELKGSNIIETPDHWEGLVYPDSFTVTLTPIGRFSHLYVEKIEDYKVFIADAYMNPIHCYYTVWAERKDIPKLVTEY